MIEKIKNWYRKDRKIIIAALVIGATVTIGFSAVKAYSDNVTKDLASQFIRLHVLANSDNPYDQILKLDVRDAVLEAMSEELKGCRSVEETRDVINGSLDKIESIAMNVINEQGYDYTVKASLNNAMFPTREYGDVTLVAGEYEALRIEIGEAEGKNWWCVVYPPLCYVDVATGKTDEKTKTQLKTVLNDDQYRFVVQQEDDVPVKVKFKVVELFQEAKLGFLALGK